MTEKVEIELSSKLDASGLDQLRKALNEQRNELNAVARETEKTDVKFKQLKATTSELNRLIKLSDADLKKYSQSLIQTDQALVKVSNSKKQLVTHTDKLTKSFSTLKTNVGSYSTTLVNLTGDIARGDKSILESVGTLGLYAGGWAAVASGIYLAVQQLVSWNNENSKVIQNRQLNTPSKDGSLGKYDQLRPKGLGMFDVNIGPQWDLSNTQYSPTRDDMSGPFDAERMRMILERDRAKFGGTSPKVAEVIVKTAYDSLEDQMSFLFKGGTRSARDIFAKKVYTSATPGTVDSSFADSFSGISPIQASRDLFEDAQGTYSAISSTMSVLNIGADSFSGKMINMFGSILTITEAIKAVNTIFSFIPGFAGGGSPPVGSPFWVGEKGPELMTVNTPSYVMNHSDSMRFTQATSTSSPVNLYLNANVDISASLKKTQKKYNRVTIK